MECEVFHITLSLGLPHPDYLLGLLSWQQVEDWRQYYEQEPWGEDRADLRAENQRLIQGGATYPTGAPPNAIWPYYEAEKHDLETIYRMMRERKAAKNG